MNAICFDCETEPAIREWDCGEVHARLIGMATIPLCGPCWKARDSYEPPDPSMDDTRPNASERLQAAKGLK